MKIGVIADDFTGASDIALTLSEAGMTTAQFIGIPESSADPGLDAGVIALKSRTAPVADAVAQSLAALEWLLAQGARQIIFKVCSTFDSTPAGNIGLVLDALAARLQADRTLVCPAFPENGRSVYQGHLFVNDTLLNESGMQDHPLTPMTDPDLRRVLASQSTQAVGHIPALTVLKGPEAITAAAMQQIGHFIVDAISDADLMVIGQAARDMPLLCGGSGIALGLPAQFGAVPGSAHWEPVTGPGVVLSGSCSRATLEQVAVYRAIAPAFEISADAALSGAIDPVALADWACAQLVPPLLFSSASPETLRAAQAAHGREAVATKIETLFSDIAAALETRGVSRIVVAGGETSGAVVSSLCVQALEIGPRAAAGVPVVRVAGRPLALALKSGNFGGKDFFADALAQMERAA